MHSISLHIPLGKSFCCSKKATILALSKCPEKRPLPRVTRMTASMAWTENETNVSKNCQLNIFSSHIETLIITMQTCLSVAFHIFEGRFLSFKKLRRAVNEKAKPILLKLRKLSKSIHVLLDLQPQWLTGHGSKIKAVNM